MQHVTIELMSDHYMMPVYVFMRCRGIIRVVVCGSCFTFLLVNKYLWERKKTHTKNTHKKLETIFVGGLILKRGK